MLRREGWNINRKRVHRLYVDMELQLSRKTKKKRASRIRVKQEKPQKLNQRWSMDFVSDVLQGGRRFRILTIVDLFSRECRALNADVSLKAKNVVATLEGLRQNGQLPEVITVDNGSEFASKRLDAWAYYHGVKLAFIRPGKPIDNCYIESFNGRLRDECLNVHIFSSLADAKAKLREWLQDYNNVRPHGSIGHIPPREYAQRFNTLASEGKFLNLTLD